MFQLHTLVSQNLAEQHNPAGQLRNNQPTQKTIVGNEIAQESNFYVKALKALREKNEMKFKDTTLEKEFNKLVTQYENQQQSSN